MLTMLERTDMISAAHRPNGLMEQFFSRHRGDGVISSLGYVCQSSI